MPWPRTATRFHKEPTKRISLRKSYPPHRLLQQNEPKFDIEIGVEIKSKVKNLDTAANVGEGLDPLHSWHGFGADHSQCAPRVVHLHGQLLRHRHSLSSDIANLSTNKNRRNSLKISLLPLCLCLRFEGGTEGVCACMACGAWPDGKGLREWMRFWGFYLRRKDFWPTVTAACKCGWCYLVGCPNVWSWLQIPICMHRPKKYSPASFSMN